MTDELITTLCAAVYALEARANAIRSSGDIAYANAFGNDAERIRTHIADLRAGNLVRREEVVARERERCARVAETRRDCATGEMFHAPDGSLPSGRLSGSVALTPTDIAAAIRAGEQP